MLVMRNSGRTGVPVGVVVSPIIPGLNDSEIPRILEQAAEAGASSASYTAIRLPGSVEEVFLKRLREAMPLRAERVIKRMRDIRDGCLDDGRFHERMRGSGPYWESIRSLFAISKKRCGLNDAYCAGPMPVEVYNRPKNVDEQLGFDFAC